MSSTLKQLGQAIAIKAGLPVPTTIVGNTDRTVQAIFQAIKDGSQKDAYRDVDWAVLHLEYTFTTLGSDYYDMPTDFDRLVNNTIWDRTNGCTLVGPVGPEKWQLYVSGLSGMTGSRRICRIVGQNRVSPQVFKPPRLQIYPDDSSSTSPNTAEDPIDVAYEYITTKYIMSGGQNFLKFNSEWVTDDDYSLIDDDVIEAAALWRLLRILGMSYSDEREEYNALVLERGSSDGGAETLSLLQNDYMFGVNIPDTGFGS
jgi:hypothetical protein